MDNVIQVRLFDAVIRKFKNRATALEDYQKRFPGTGSSAARARFNATNSITYSHGMQVAAAYHLHDLDIWPEGWPDTDVFAQIPILGENIGFYLEMLNNDLANIHKNGQYLLHMAIHEVPFIMLKHYRELVGFSLYCSLSLEMNHSVYRRFTFGDKFMHDTQITGWLDLCQKALTTYQEIPGVEYWSPFMLRSLVQKINLVEKLGLFEDKEMAKRLHEDLKKLTDDLEHKAHLGKKVLGPLAEGAAVRIFNHEGIVTNTLIIAEAQKGGTASFCFEERGLSHLLRFDSTAARNKLNALENAGHLGGALGSALDKNFFSRLRQSLVA
jgi:hypothetical protein